MKRFRDDRPGDICLARGTFNAHPYVMGSMNEFLRRMEGSAIRRIGYARWSRNIAVALGNAAPSPGIVAALQRRADDASELVREHVAWALARQRERLAE